MARATVAVLPCCQTWDRRRHDVTRHIVTATFLVANCDAAACTRTVVTSPSVHRSHAMLSTMSQVAGEVPMTALARVQGVASHHLRLGLPRRVQVSRWAGVHPSHPLLHPRKGRVLRLLDSEISRTSLVTMPTTRSLMMLSAYNR
jgi:hypothetical protein